MEIMGLPQKFGLGVVVLLSSVVTPAVAQTIPTSGAANTSLQPLDDFLLHYMTKYNLVGGALAVTKNGRLLYARGYGNVDPGGPVVQPDTLFRVASISKVITSKALRVLMEDRNLSSNEPVLPYINDLTPNVLPDPRMGAITIEHCMNFSTGILDDPNWYWGPAMVFQTRHPTQAWIDLMYELTKPLASDPGANSVYTGWGHEILARVIDAITGHYEAYVRTHFLVPKGLTRARIASTREADLSPWEAEYFPFPRNSVEWSDYPEDTQPVPVPYQQDRESVDAAGGWLASAIDLAFLDVGPGPNRAELPPPYAPPQSIASAFAGGASGTVAWEIVTWDDYTFGLAFNTNEDQTVAPQDELHEGIVNAAGAVTQWPTSDLFPAFLSAWSQAPRFSVDTSPLQFAYTIGGPIPTPAVLRVVSSGPPESFKITSPNHSWLQISPTTGASTMEISISVDPSAGPPYVWDLPGSCQTQEVVSCPNYGPLIPGTYRSSIYIESAERPLSPFFIPVTLIVQPAGPTIAHIDVKTPHQLSTLAVNQFSSVTLSAVGGTPPYAWSVASGKLPVGLTLAQNGQISGTPAAAGDYSFLATVVDSKGWTTTRRFDATVLDTAAESPIINQGGVVNAASQIGPISPGSLVTIYGTRLSSVTLSATTVPLPFELAGVQVSFNGTPAPLLFVSPNQINSQMPWTGQDYSVDITVTSGGLSSQPQQISVESFAPALFEFSGTNQAVAINPDGTVSAPNGVIAGVSSHPAKIGDTIQLWGTGLGPVFPQCATGDACGKFLSWTMLAPVVTVGNAPAVVTFAGLSPTFVGVNQINVTIPEGVSPGNAVSLVLLAYGQPRYTTAVIAIQ